MSQIYRRQMEAEAEAAAGSEPAFKRALRKAGPSGRAGGGALPASPEAEGDDLSIALEVLADSGAPTERFTAALQAMSLEVTDHPELMDTLLAYLSDAAKPPGPPPRRIEHAAGNQLSHGGVPG